MNYDIQTDVASRSAESTPAHTRVVGLVDWSTAAAATQARVRVARVRRHAAVDARRRAARQNLELGRDTREVEHAPVDEHLLETTCHHHADGQLDSRPGRTLARLLINPHRFETTCHHHADNLTRFTARPDASPPVD